MWTTDLKCCCSVVFTSQHTGDRYRFVLLWYTDQAQVASHDSYEHASWETSHGNCTWVLRSCSIYSHTNWNLQCSLTTIWHLYCYNPFCSERSHVTVFLFSTHATPLCQQPKNIGLKHHVCNTYIVWICTEDKKWHPNFSLPGSAVWIEVFRTCNR